MLQIEIKSQDSIPFFGYIKKIGVSRTSMILILPIRCNYGIIKNKSNLFDPPSLIFFPFPSSSPLPNIVDSVQLFPS